MGEKVWDRRPFSEEELADWEVRAVRRRYGIDRWDSEDIYRLIVEIRRLRARLAPAEAGDD